MLSPFTRNQEVLRFNTVQFNAFSLFSRSFTVLVFSLYSQSICMTLFFSSVLSIIMIFWAGIYLLQLITAILFLFVFLILLYCPFIF